MKLYILEWDSRLERSDNRLTLLGIYTSRLLCEAAIARYEPLRGQKWPFNKEGSFEQSEVAANFDVITGFVAGTEAAHGG